MSDGPAVVISNEAATNVAEVKAGSTAAVAADKALVVAVSPNNVVPVSGPLTDTQLRATPVPVSDGGGSLTVDGTVAVSNFPAVQPVSDNSGSLTVDTPQLPAALVGARLDVNVGQVPSYLDANNSTTTPLGNGGVFTGTATEVLNFAAIGVSILTDKNSATDGLQLQWSPDGSNWDQGEVYTLAANTPFFINATVRARYFRLVLTNGGVAQTFLRIQTFLSSSAPTPRKIPVQNVPSDNDPAQLTQAVIVGKTTGGGGAYVAVKVSPSGAVQVGGAVDVSSSALPSGAATSALQTQPGVDIGDVTINNAAGASAVNIQDGGNSITVDGPLTDAQLRASAVPVSATSLPLPTGAATEATLALIKNTDGIKKITDALPTGTNELGKVKVTDNSGNVIGVLSRTLYSDPNGDRRTVHNDATITASGSTVLTWNGHSEWYLIINLKNAPTGTAPTIQFKVEQVDPIDQTTILTPAAPDVKSATGVVHTAAGVESLEITELVSDAVKISWIVTGTSPSWTGVNVSWCGHGSGNAIEGQSEEGEELHDGPVPIAGVDNANLIHTLKVDDSGRLVVTAASAGATVRGFALGTMVTTATTDVPIRATTYTEQTSNAQRSLSSANANDTSAGTGARQVRVTYLTSTGAGPYFEDVTMNGTSAVNMVATDVCYIEKIEVISVGSTGSNVGIITLFVSTGGGGGAIGTIAATANRTFWGHHYTPTGFSTFITSIAGHNSHTSNVTVLSIRGKPLTGTGPEMVVSDYVAVGGATAQESRNYGTAIEVAGPARLILYGAPAGTPSITSRASFDFFDQDVTP